MYALSASQLLEVWEQGLFQPVTRRTLSLLQAAYPETSLDALAQLPIGQRDALLLSLREWLFGPQLTGLATCPQCGEKLELAFDVADIRAEAPELFSEGVEHEEKETSLTLTFGEYSVRVRLPNSLDALAIAGAHDVMIARQMFLDRCLVAVNRDTNAISANELPSQVVTALVERMAEADPQANVQLALNCLHCGQAWQAVFDIVAFFWGEINAWAIRTLREVHDLASAYRWGEADILALTPTRRQLYLEMIGA